MQSDAKAKECCLALLKQRVVFLCWGEALSYLIRTKCCLSVLRQSAILLIETKLSFYLLGQSAVLIIRGKAAKFPKRICMGDERVDSWYSPTGHERVDSWYSPCAQGVPLAKAHCLASSGQQQQGAGMQEPLHRRMHPALRIYVPFHHTSQSCSRQCTPTAHPFGLTLVKPSTHDMSPAVSSSGR